jgi:hypothetical protein
MMIQMKSSESTYYKLSIFTGILSEGTLKGGIMSGMVSHTIDFYL